MSPHSPATLSMLLSFYPLPTRLLSVWDAFAFHPGKGPSPRRDGTLTLEFKHMLSAALHRGSLLGLFLRRHHWQVDLFMGIGHYLSLAESCLDGLGVDGLGIDPGSVSQTA